MNKLRLLIFLPFILFVMVAKATGVSTRNKGDSYSLAMNISGTVIASGACTLDPDTSNISLDFGGTVDKYLYTNGRTQGDVFTIKLSGCDTQLGSSVTFTFQGTEDTALPGLLAVKAGLPAGVAVGIETSDGEALPVNRATPAFNLIDGDNTINLKGYLQGEPDAIRNRLIALESFSAVSNFVISYQ